MWKRIDPQTLSHAKMSYALEKKSCEETVRTQVPKDGNRFCQSDLAGKWSGDPTAGSSQYKKNYTPG